MEVGIKQAKNELSRLIERAQRGEKIVITNHGRPAVQLTPAPKKPAPGRGYGLLKNDPRVKLYPGWDSQETDKAIARMFLEGL